MKSLLKRIKLLKGLFQGDFAYTGPFYAQIDVTSRCNLQCLCCRYHSPLLDKSPQDNRSNKDFPFNLFGKLCNDLKTMNTGTIVFAGSGEPMLHPRIYDMISVAKSNGLEVIMFTNGTLLNELTVKSLIDSQLDILKVTLWASSTDEYKQQYPEDNPNNFNKVITGLQLLSRFKIEGKTSFPFVEVRYPINSNNLNTIERIVDLTCKTGSNKLHFSLAKASGGEKLRQYLLTPDEEKFIRLSMIQAKNQLNSQPIQHNIDQEFMRYGFEEEFAWEKVPCYIAWYYADIRVDGRVLACQRCDITMGNLHDSDFCEIWNNTSFRAFRRRGAINEDLTSISDHCNCSFCCHIMDNRRVYKYLKWFRPFYKI